MRPTTTGRTRTPSGALTSTLGALHKVTNATTFRVLNQASLLSSQQQSSETLTVLLGAVAAISLLALRDGWLPPNLNLLNPAPACDLDFIREPEGRERRVDYVLSNSFGFGGINACLLFGRV